MTEQNRKYVQKEIGKLLSEIWRVKGQAEQEYGPTASHHQETGHHACRSTGITARELWKRIGT